MSSLQAVKQVLGIPPEVTTSDGVINLHLSDAERVILRYCKKADGATFDRQIYTEYRDGPGQPELALWQRPVQVFLLNGTVTEGSYTVTGISSAATLLAGMPVTGNGVPAETYVASVDSLTQVTLTAAATATTTGRLVFGLVVYEDAGGFWGEANDAFPAAQSGSSQLVLGLNYGIRRDTRENTSKSAVLVRLSGSPVGSSAAIWPWGWRTGTLTARLPPIWPAGYGSLKVVYCAGYREIPVDLMEAATLLTVWLFRNAKTGGMQLSNESYEGYSYGLTALGQNPELGTVRQRLRSYRETVI